MTPRLNPSADLAERVNAYNIRRAQEYWTWRRHIESLPNGEPVPNFITQHRHCPCGQVSSGTPCPDHENENFGQFPDWFWTISPHLIAYAQCLTARNLPYRNPNECIPREFLLLTKRNKKNEPSTPPIMKYDNDTFKKLGLLPLPVRFVDESTKSTCQTTARCAV